jgi:hypothetical protein
MKKTPWFPVRTPPVRVGLYEFRMAGCNETTLFEWTGKEWCWSLSRMLIDKCPGDRWRGLAQDPSKT